MKTYQLRNLLSKEDQHKHVYVKLPNNTLVCINDCKIKEVNGVLVIEVNK